MWYEVVDPSGKVVGAVNTDCCDLIKIHTVASEGALMRSAVSTDSTTGEAEVYKTKVSYLRIIENITQSEVKSLQQIADIVGDNNDLIDRHSPRIIL